MKSIFAFILTTATGLSALAYKDGTYSCKNANGLPNNVYKIQTIQLTSQGASLPYVDVTNYYHSKPGDPTSEVKESRLKGFATVVATDDGTEILLLASMTFEFKDGQMVRCRQ